MKLLLLSYPLTPVCAGSCGGTEQMAHLLLGSLARRRDLEVTWVGAAGSRPHAGIHFLGWPRLLAQCGLPPPPAPPIAQPALDRLLADCAQAARQWAHSHRHELDLIHNLGALWPTAAGGFPAPLLFSLHLARCLYPADWGRAPVAGLHLQCVSHTQAAGYGPAACCGVIGNGIDLQRFPARRRAPGPDAPLLYLGRICPEKAPHAALALARSTRRRLWMVGEVAPFPSHQRYFREQIAPQLNPDRRWLPPPSPRHKLRLLRAAAAVVIPSRIAETSSIVAMEAAACGVPVLAARVGALPEVVADGETGFLGDDAELAAAVDRLPMIVPAACRRRAERDFSAADMAAAYRRLYRRLAARPWH